jgi:hypothetical protein
MSKNTNLSFLTDYITADITNGRIGINNASPTVAFDVVGAGKFSSSVTADGLFRSNQGIFQVYGVGTFRGGLYNYAQSTGSGTDYSPTLLSETDLYFTTGGSSTKKVVITSAGNVGIGTSSPISTLDARGIISVGSAAGVYSVIQRSLAPSGSQGIILTAGTGKTEGGGGISFSDNSSSGGTIILGGNSSDIYGGGVYIVAYGQTSTANIINFETRSGNGTTAERMRITSIGNLLMAKDKAIGINTSDGADNGYLALCGAGDGGENRGGHIYLSGNERSADPGSVVISAGNVIGTGSFIFFRTAGTEKMRIIGSGNVLIGSTSDNGYKLQVTGSIYATGSIVANSDLTLKKNLAIINNPIDKLMQLNGYTYQWKANDEHQYGVIAQEVEKILPYAVSTGDDGIKGVSYNQIIPVLIEAIKELSAEITILKNK